MSYNFFVRAEIMVFPKHIGLPYPIQDSFMISFPTDIISMEHVIAATQAVAALKYQETTEQYRVDKIITLSKIHP